MAFSWNLMVIYLSIPLLSFSSLIHFIKKINPWWIKRREDKNAGFIILLTSSFTFFFFGEIRNLTTFTRLMDYNNGFSISSFFLSLVSFLWIGAQFPQEKFLSYARILTLDFYFLIMCTLFSNPSSGLLLLFVFNGWIFGKRNRIIPKNPGYSFLWSV